MAMTRKKGFTLVELIVAMVLGSVLLLAGWYLSSATSTQTRQVRSISSLAQFGLDVDATLSTDVAEAGRGLFSMPNIGPVEPILSASTTDTLDALVIIKPPMLDNQELPDTTVYRISSMSCPSGAPSPCLLLIGNATAVVGAGQTMIAGNPTLGGEIISVVSATSLSLACLTDCQNEYWQNPGSYQGPSSVATFSGSTPSYSIVDVSTPPDSSYCGGTSSQTFAAATSDSTTYGQLVYSPSSQTCTPGSIRTSTLPASSLGTATLLVSNAASQVFTQVVYTAQTAALGFPQIPTSTIHPGINNSPAAYAQRINIVRYYVEKDSSKYSQPTLIRQSGWAGGVFAINAPVVPGLRYFAVETRHTPASAAISDAADELNYTRQVVATPRSLSQSTENLDSQSPACTTPLTNNWHRNAAPTDSARLQGWYFCRSFATISALRVRYRTVTRYRKENKGAQDSTVRVFATTMATPNVLSGGSIVPP